MQGEQKMIQKQNQQEKRIHLNPSNKGFQLNLRDFAQYIKNYQNSQNELLNIQYNNNLLKIRIDEELKEQQNIKKIKLAYQNESFYLLDDLVDGIYQIALSIKVKQTSIAQELISSLRDNIHLYQNLQQLYVLIEDNLFLGYQGFSYLFQQFRNCNQLSYLSLKILEGNLLGQYSCQAIIEGVSLFLQLETLKLNIDMKKNIKDHEIIQITKIFEKLKHLKSLTISLKNYRSSYKFNVELLNSLNKQQNLKHFSLKIKYSYLSIRDGYELLNFYQQNIQSLESLSITFKNIDFYFPYIESEVSFLEKLEIENEELQINQFNSSGYFLLGLSHQLNRLRDLKQVKLYFDVETPYCFVDIFLSNYIQSLNQAKTKLMFSILQFDEMGLLIQLLGSKLSQIQNLISLNLKMTSDIELNLFIDFIIFLMPLQYLHNIKLELFQIIENSIVDPIKLVKCQKILQKIQCSEFVNFNVQCLDKFTNIQLFELIKRLISLKTLETTLSIVKQSDIQNKVVFYNYLENHLLLSLKKVYFNFNNQNLEIDYCSLFQWIQKMNNIEDLQIYTSQNYSFNQSQCISLRNTLRNLKDLKSFGIYLGFQNTQQNSFQIFCEGLQQLKKLKVLDLQIFENSIKCEEFQYLRNFIQNAGSLKQLHLYFDKNNCFQDAQGINPFSQLFISSIYLTNLDICINGKENFINQATLKILFKSMSILQQLESLKFIALFSQPTLDDIIEIRKYVSNLKLLSYFNCQFNSIFTLYLINLHQDLSFLHQFQDLHFKIRLKRNCQNKKEKEVQKVLMQNLKDCMIQKKYNNNELDKLIIEIEPIIIKQGLAEIVKCFERLLIPGHIKINLENCISPDKRSFLKLFSRFHNLRTLSFKNVSCLNNQFLQGNLKKNFFKIKSLVNLRIVNIIQ